MTTDVRDILDLSLTVTIPLRGHAPVTNDHGLKGQIAASELVLTEPVEPVHQRLSHGSLLRQSPKDCVKQPVAPVHKRPSKDSPKTVKQPVASVHQKAEGSPKTVLNSLLH